MGCVENTVPSTLTGERLADPDSKAVAMCRRPAPPAVMEVRVLVLGWCVYLLVGWGGVLWLTGWFPPRLPMGPIRWMNVLALVGVVVVWPAFRLSQSPRVRRVAEGAGSGGAVGMGLLPIAGRFEVGLAVLDWVSLGVIWQAVWLTLWMRSDWGVWQAVLVDLAVLGPAAGVAALIAGSRQTRSGAMRLGAMGLCVAWLLAEPAWMVATRGGWMPQVTPIAVVWGLAGSGVETAARVRAWWPHVAAMWLAAGLAWAAVGVWARGVRREDTTGGGVP